MPAAVLGGDTISLGWTPGATVILVERGMHLEHRVDDAPGRFHAVFPIELRDITVHGVADEALVSAHAIVLLVGNEEFHVLAGDGRSRPLGTDTQADGDPVRTQPEAYIVRALGERF